MHGLIKTVLLITPIVLTVVVYIKIIKKPLIQKVLFICLLGWTTLIVSTFGYWWYATNFVSNVEIINDAIEDGENLLMASIVFGWVYGLLLFTAFEFLFKLSKKSY